MQWFKNHILRWFSNLHGTKAFCHCLSLHSLLMTLWRSDLAAVPGTGVEVSLQIPVGVPGWHCCAQSLCLGVLGASTGTPPLTLGSAPRGSCQPLGPAPTATSKMFWLWQTSNDFENCPQLQSLWDWDWEPPSFCSGHRAMPWVPVLV